MGEQLSPGFTSFTGDNFLGEEAQRHGCLSLEVSPGAMLTISRAGTWFQEKEEGPFPVLTYRQRTQCPEGIDAASEDRSPGEAWQGRKPGGPTLLLFAYALIDWCESGPSGRQLECAPDIQAW